jgi:hypothetical protein
MPSCAICTREAPASDLTKQPLGARGALVLVCRACDEEPAREKFGPEISRDIDDDSKRVSGREFRRRCAVVVGNTPWFNKHGAWVDDATPGFVIVRVGRDRAHPLDSNEAREKLRGQPWFSELRYLGSTDAHIIFERPSNETIARRREEATLAATSKTMRALECFRATATQAKPDQYTTANRAGRRYKAIGTSRLAHRSARPTDR